jgi:hypothetical protein
LWFVIHYLHFMYKERKKDRKALRINFLFFFSFFSTD